MFATVCRVWIVVLGLASPTAARARSIAFTFDDAPRAGTVLFDGPTRTARLIDALRAANVATVTFFANSIRLDDEGRRRLASYAAAGHAIGNHTHSHPDANVTELPAYLEDIRRADEALRDLPGFARWFRFPFLREGPDAERRDGLRAELARLGYANAYITVNNYDWEIDRLLQVALQSGRTVDYARLREVYLEVLLACVEFYDRMAVEVLGRSPAHVILLHENDLNALFVADLAEALRDRGWTIVSPEDAYRDEIAAAQTERLFRFNPGRIGEIARDRGYAGDLWHESCDEEYLRDLLERRGAFGGR